MKNLTQFNSLLEVIQTFSNEEKCIEYLKEQRWNNTPICPHCNSEHKIYEFKDKKRYSCGVCLKQFTVKVGTIFENSKIGLTKWFAAIYLLTSRKKGISSLQLSRDLNITQKSAWFLSQRIRRALKQEYFGLIETTAEVDETFIGGKEKNKAKHKRTKETQGRSCKTKTPVVGILRRGGEVRAMSVLNTSKSQLHSFIFDNVFPQTKLMTDEWKGYKGLSKTYEHSVIKHSQEEYVRGECHTNGIEGFWSLLKRSIIGVYHSMSKKHLDRYIDECCFRYNTHKMNDSDRFHKALSKINVRLKYSDLIAEY